MAYVSIQREWPDGDKLQVTVRSRFSSCRLAMRCDTSFPDAIAEAKRAALDAFAEACGVVLAPEDKP